jgi:hypothetical protein
MRLITLLLLCFALIGCEKELSAVPAKSMSDEQVHEILKRTSKEVAAMLPSRVDESLTIYAVQPDFREKRRLIYYYQYEEDEKSIPDKEGLRARLYPLALNFYCTEPPLEPLREIGVTFEYNYVDINSVYLFSNYLSLKDCP